MRCAPEYWDAQWCLTTGEEDPATSALSGVGLLVIV